MAESPCICQAIVPACIVLLLARADQELKKHILNVTHTHQVLSVNVDPILNFLQYFNHPLDHGAIIRTSRIMEDSVPKPVHSCNISHSQ